MVGPHPQPVAFALDPAVAVLLGLAAAGATLATGAVVFLLRRLERRRDAELQSLAALALAISSAPDDAGEIAEAAYVHTSRQFPADFFQLGLFHGETYRTLIWVRDGDRLRNREFSLHPDHQGLVGWVRETGEPLLVRDFRRTDDLPARPSYVSDDPPLSGLFVPILVDNTVVGVVAVQSRKPGAFRRRELLLLRALAAALGTALASLAWRDEVRQREKELALAEDVARLLTPLRSLAEVMPEAAATIARRLEADQVVILQLQEGRRIPLASAGPRAEALAATAELDSLLQEAAESKAPVSRAREAQTGEQVTWECAAPLVVQDRVLGMLYLNRGGRPFLGRERRPVDLVASQLALAVLEAANYAQQQEEAWYTTVLLEVARHASRPGDQAAALESVLQLTTLLAGAGWAVLLISDADSGRLLMGPAAGLSRERGASLVAHGFSVAEFGLADADTEEIPREVTLPPPLADACGAHEALGILLSDGRRPLGLLLIGAKGLRDRSLALLSGIGHQVSLRLENTILVEEAAVRRSLERELETARAIQKGFLPTHAPEVPEWRLEAFWRAARSVGGDFYDFIPLPEGSGGPRWGLAVADVSDKGVPAALYMALTRTLLRTIAPSSATPAATLTRLNQLLLHETRAEMFVSLWYGIWEPATGRVTYANAGHAPPLLFSPDDPPRLLRSHKTVLGVLPEVDYQDETVDLGPGSLLLLYTDGVSEAVGPGGDLFGVHRIEHAVRSLDPWDPSAVLETLEDRVAAFSGRPEPHDDLTIVCLYRVPMPIAELPGGGQHAST